MNLPSSVQIALVKSMPHLDGSGKRAKERGKMVPEGRIVEKVIQAYRSNDLTSLINWLEKLGCKDITRDRDSATLTGLTGMRVGFILGDPATLAVCTGFALFGPYWTSVCPELLKRVNKLWKAELKK